MERERVIERERGREEVKCEGEEGGGSLHAAGTHEIYYS